MRQQILDRQYETSSGKTGARNIIYQCRGAGVEGEAYPSRPSFGWELPINPKRAHSVVPLTTTKLWIEAPTLEYARTNWTIGLVSGLDLVNTAKDRVSADRVGGYNDLTQGASGSRPIISKGNLNHRPAMLMAHGDYGHRYLEKASPVGVGSSVAEVDDLTVMAVFMLGEQFATETIPLGGYIVSCESTGQGQGWAVGVDSTKRPYFKCQGTTVPGLLPLVACRRYLIIGRRKMSDGTLTVTCDGITTAPVVGPNIGLPLTISSNRLMVGGRYTGSAVDSNTRFKGFIAAIHVELADLFKVDDRDPAGTVPIMDRGFPLGSLIDAGSGNGIERLHYFRSAWGVW